MSVIDSNFLSLADGSDIRTFLKQKGVLKEKELSFYNFKEGKIVYTTFENVVDYMALPEEIVKEEREKIISEGCWVGVPEFGNIQRYLDLGFKVTPSDNKTSYTYLKRELSEKEIEGRMGQRVMLSNDEHTNTPYIYWQFNYGFDDTPAYLLSKAFKDVEFHFHESVEGDVVQDCIIKNGEVIKDLMPEVA